MDQKNLEGTNVVQDSHPMLNFIVLHTYIMFFLLSLYSFGSFQHPHRRLGNRSEFCSFLLVLKAQWCCPVTPVKLSTNLRQTLEKKTHSTNSRKPASNSSLLWWAKQRRQPASPLIYQRVVITFQKLNYCSSVAWGRCNTDYEFHSPCLSVYV